MPQVPSCPLLPVATGAVELSGGVAATEFLALARADAPSIPARTPPPETTGRMRNIVAPILAERIMRARGAQLPASWPRATAQVLAFPAMNLPDPASPPHSSSATHSDPGWNNEGHAVFFIASTDPVADRL
jgi:hypothetical protein